MFLLLPLSGSETVIGAAQAWNPEPLFPLIATCAGVILLGIVLRLLPRVLDRFVDFFQFVFDRPEPDHPAVPPPLPRSYVRRPNLLTPAEIRFYRELQAFSRAHGLRIFVQVRIADVLQPLGREISDLSRIAQKHVDFVAVDSEFRVWFAVELDDWTHSRSKRVARDVLVDHAFASAALPLIRFGQDWSPEMIVRKISPILQISV